MYGSMTTSGTDGGRNPGVRYSEDAVLASAWARQREIQTRNERKAHHPDPILAKTVNYPHVMIECGFVYITCVQIVVT